MSEQQPVRRIALVGFGEVGTIFATDLVAKGVACRPTMSCSTSPAAAPAMRERARAAGVTTCSTLLDAVRDVDLVISAVTASSSRDVAGDAARWMRPGQIFLDVNSVSPDTKRGNAAASKRAGASYVEAGGDGSGAAQRLAVPMLLGEATRATLAQTLTDSGHERDRGCRARSALRRRSRCAAAS